MTPRSPLLHLLAVAGLMLGGACAHADVVGGDGMHHGTRQRSAVVGGQQSGGGGFDTHPEPPRDKHLRYPLQTTPDIARQQQRDSFRHGYRDGYQDGMQDRGRYQDRDGYNSRDGYRGRDGYQDRYPSRRYGQFPGYGYPSPGYQQNWPGADNAYPGSGYGDRNQRYAPRGRNDDYPIPHDYPSIPPPIRLQH